MIWYDIFEIVLTVVLIFSSIIIFTYALRFLLFIFTFIIFSKKIPIIMKDEKKEGFNKSIYVDEKTDNNYADFFLLFLY